MKVKCIYCTVRQSPGPEGGRPIRSDPNLSGYPARSPLGFLMPTPRKHDGALVSRHGVDILVLATIFHIGPPHQLLVGRVDVNDGLSTKSGES